MSSLEGMHPRWVQVPPSGPRSTSVKALRKALERVRDRGLRKQIRTSVDVLTSRRDSYGELPDAIFWEDRDDDARDA